MCRAVHRELAVLARDPATRTFVPPHIHPTQDEFIYMLQGRLDLVVDGKDGVANPGDTVRLPRASRTACTTGVTTT